MAQMRMKGVKIGANVGSVTATVGSATDSAPATSWLKPARLTTVPALSDTYDGDIMVVDIGSLTNPSNYDFREFGGSSLQNGAADTFDTTGHGGKIAQVFVTADPGNTVYASPPIMINTMMMGMPTSMMLDERAFHATVPHNTITHWAVNSGPWSAGSTWYGGRVPHHGAITLIPNGVTVIYDEARKNIRTSRVRIDGRLEFARDQDTHWFLETGFVSRAGELVIGENDATRLPEQFACDIVISGKDYDSESYTPTDMSAVTLDALRAWGRGIICLGAWPMWGADKTPWGWADVDAPPVLAGDTSLTFDRDMLGLAVGDELIIGPTKHTYLNEWYTEHDLELQTDFRVITEINGRTVTWAEPLDYDHDNPLLNSTREDIRPPIAVKGNNNITIRSEVTDPEQWWRRGHTACMHGFAKMDWWNVNLISLGRTNKEDWWDGLLIDDNTVDTYENGRVQIPLEPRSNIQSRYAVHAHLLGFGRAEDARPIVDSCYIEDVVGWGVVHHDCDADFFRNVIHKWFGAGMVSEQGSEIGAWSDNLAIHSSWVARLPNPWDDGFKYSDFKSNPKTTEGGAGTAGIFGRLAFGYYYKGRAIRGNGNVACGCAYGHNFGNRIQNATNQIVPTKNPPRDYIDIKETGIIRDTETSVTANEFNFVDYPILHMADNISLACVYGHFVTKQNVAARHDVNVKFKRPKAYGASNKGISAEYVGTYIFDRPDMLGQGNYRGSGSGTGSQSMQVIIVNPRSENVVDRGAAIVFAMQTTSGLHENFDNVEDPRWGLIGLDDPNGNGINWDGHSSAIKPGPDVTFIDDDWDGSFIDYDLDPSDNVPLVVGEVNGSGISVLNIPDTDSYFKTDNLSDKGRIIYKRGKDWIWPQDRNDVQTFRNKYGYWEYDAGNGVEAFNRMPYIISDRITGRPFKGIKLLKLTGADVTGTNNGTLVIAPTPITLATPNLRFAIQKNGSVSFNIITETGPSGAGGSYTLDMGDFIAPDYGRILHSENGDITYTPDRRRVGVDECYFFIYSDNQYKAVRVTFIVNEAGTAPALIAAASPLNFEVVNHGDANTAGVYLKKKVETNEMLIDTVQYSTDGGATWGLLCHGWIRDTHRVKVESDGVTPIAAGDYNIRIRYRTFYNLMEWSPASDDIPVTVT